jgi:hypothetical protein
MISKNVIEHVFYAIHRKEVRNIKLIEKMKIKIRNKLIKFIQQDELECALYTYVNGSLKDVRDNLRVTSNDLYSKVKDNREDIDILHNTIRSVVSIGTDVVHNHGNERSWAVICIEGNYNIVKFIDLHGADYRYIMDFLKQFEGSRMVIDAPNPIMFESIFKL